MKKTPPRGPLGHQLPQGMEILKDIFESQRVNMEVKCKIVIEMSSICLSDTNNVGCSSFHPIVYELYGKKR